MVLFNNIFCADRILKMDATTAQIYLKPLIHCTSIFVLYKIHFFGRSETQNDRHNTNPKDTSENFSESQLNILSPWLI